MIDLGLTKIAILGVVALIVIGPEKLPKVARTVGTLYGRAQRYLNDVKSEVSREMELDELRNLHKEVQEAARSVTVDIHESIARSLDDTVESDHLPAPVAPATMAAQERKAREFRRKKLVRSSAIPAWYKQRHGGKMHVISGAARVTKFRPSGASHASFFK